MKIIINESQFINLFEAANLTDIHKKYYNKIPEDIFMKIVSADPTYRVEKSQKMGKYGKWLLQLYLNRRLKLEDLYKATDYLRCFVDYYNVIKDKDINKIKSLQELYEIVQPYLGGDIATSKSDEVRKIKEDAEKVYEDNEWLVIIPHTQAASCYYGKGTQWCTAAERSNNMFDHYNSQGPLYINIDKVNGAKYQFHFESDSFMDENDNPIDSPVADTCGLSEGLCNWYRENVEESLKIFEVWVDFFYIEESACEYVMIQNEEDETIYRLYDKTNNENICGGLVCSDGIQEMRKWYLTLYKKGYCIIPNVKGLYTLIIHDSDSLYDMVDNAVSVEKIGNNYSDMNDEYIFFDVTYEDGSRCILENNGTNQYQCEDGSMIQYMDSVTYDCIEIKKTNGFSDLLNWNYEQIFYNLRDIEFNYDEDDVFYAYNKEGHRIKVNMYNGNEEVVDDIKENINKVLKKFINEVIDEDRTELQDGLVEVDNFEAIKKLMKFENPGDTLYFIQIKKRDKDNPGQKSQFQAAMHLKEYYIRSLDELNRAEQEIKTLCANESARAYIWLNARSSAVVDKYAERNRRAWSNNPYLLKKYGRKYSALAAAKSLDTDDRPLCFVDVDSDDPKDIDMVLQIIKNANIKPIYQYRSLNNGLHIILPNKEDAKKLDFSSVNGDLSGMNKVVKMNAKVGVEIDKPVLLYACLKPQGYDKQQARFNKWTQGKV